MNEVLPEIFQIKSATILINCKHRISNIEPSHSEPRQIIITQGKNLKTNAQNRLYWLHNQQIHDQSGNERKAIHKHLKRKFLHAIFMAGSTKTNLEYQFNYQVLVDAKNLSNDPERHANLSRLHNRILSITDANITQMAKFINDYWPYVAGKGHSLKDPDTFFREQGL